LTRLVIRASRRTVFAWAAASGGIPDVSHAADDVTRECTEGSGVGFKTEPTVLCEASNDRARVLERGDAASKVAFVAELVKGVDVSWSGQLLDNGETLALHVPTGALPEGSKEIFVRILEYAEEELGCERVLVWFDKNSSDRALFIRTFMYFGFSLLAPDMIPQPLDNLNSIVMVYKID